jgi:hypothetical protein
MLKEHNEYRVSLINITMRIMKKKKRRGQVRSALHAAPHWATTNKQVRSPITGCVSLLLVIVSGPLYA